MSPRGRRVRLDTGIWQDDIGFSITAKIGGEQREKRAEKLSQRKSQRSSRAED